MMIKLNKKMIIFTALLPSLAFAETTTLTKDLMYQSKPIDALCINDPTGNAANGVISLAHCGLVANKEVRASGQNSQLVNKGYIGYNFTEKANTAISGYSYYKPFGQADDQAIVFSISSGGGSGEFTSLFLVKREGDNIRLKTLAAGDRCNNGVYDVKRKNNSLTYNVSLTPFDFLTLAKSNPHHLKAYDDLDACAACCKGTAVFTREIGPHFSNEKLSYIDLGDTKDNEESSSSQKYQACFDKLVNNYKQKGVNHLSMQQLKEFTNTFNETCVKK